MTIYTEHHCQKITPLICSMCGVVKKETSSVNDKNSQFACLAHASCFETSSMLLAQRQWRCDSYTYRAETLEQQVYGGWQNEDAVVQQLEWPVYTAQTDNPVPGHASTCAPSPQARMWLDLPHRANVAQSEAGVSSRGRTSSCRSQLALQLVGNRLWCSGQQQIAIVDPGRIEGVN